MTRSMQDWWDTNKKPTIRDYAYRYAAKAGIGFVSQNLYYPFL